jgi:hypothetical protein
MSNNSNQTAAPESGRRLADGVMIKATLSTMDAAQADVLKTASSDTTSSAAAMQGAFQTATGLTLSMPKVKEPEMTFTVKYTVESTSAAAVVVPTGAEMAASLATVDPAAATSFTFMVETPAPTSMPTSMPTPLPPGDTFSPTIAASDAPTDAPTDVETDMPTETPTTSAPTVMPTETPTAMPTNQTEAPSTDMPTMMPTTAAPTNQTEAPTAMPTVMPTPIPPTSAPTMAPTNASGGDDEEDGAIADKSVGILAAAVVVFTTFATTQIDQ